MVSWHNPLGLREHKQSKAVWIALVSSILAALGFALVTTGGTPLINLGSMAGLSTGAVGSFVGLVVLILGYDFARTGKVFWKESILGAAGGTLALVFLATPLGAAFTFSNIIGFVLGVVVLALGVYAGLYIEEMV